jgi:hypothetical protein
MALALNAAIRITERESTERIGCLIGGGGDALKMGARRAVR